MPALPIAELPFLWVPVQRYNLLKGGPKMDNEIVLGQGH